MKDIASLAIRRRSADLLYSAVVRLVKVSLRIRSTRTALRRFVMRTSSSRVDAIPMTRPNEPSSSDFRLVEEAIRRLSRLAPVAPHHGRKLQAILFSELDRGRRDMFSLMRAGRKAIDEV